MASSDVAQISYENEEQISFSIFNLNSGLPVKSYKGAKCSSHCITSVGKEYTFAAQSGKQVIHVWDTRKEQIHMKIVCPGKITALSCSPAGNYCLVALVEKIYIWQVPTGNLMQILSKHYQSVTCLKFTDDGSHFISGANDNLVIVWNLSRVLSGSDGISKQNQEPSYTWSHHSLPIRDIHVGTGGIRCRIATCSLDQTCKLYDLASGQLVRSLLFDTGLTSVVMDAAETHLFVGGITGKIHLIKLYVKRAEARTDIDGTKDSEIFNGHCKEITSLSLNLSGMTLISGSSDCTARIWHVNSGQCVKQINLKGKVTNASIMSVAKDLQPSKQQAAPKALVSNFKRKIFEQFHGNASWHEEESFGEDERCLPVALRNIDKDFLEACTKRVTNETKTMQIEEIVKMHDTFDGSSTSLHTKNRAELQNRVEHLEDLARKLCRFTTNSIINEVYNH